MIAAQDSVAHTVIQTTASSYRLNMNASDKPQGCDNNKFHNISFILHVTQMGRYLTCFCQTRPSFTIQRQSLSDLVNEIAAAADTVG